MHEDGEVKGASHLTAPKVRSHLFEKLTLWGHTFFLGGYRFARTLLIHCFFSS